MKVETKFLEEFKMSRYPAYIAFAKWAEENLQPRAKVIEFGGSNGIIPKIIGDENYEVAQNWPEVDIEHLSDMFEHDLYDLIILDQVLEHVSNPRIGIHECHDLLKPGGWLFVTTPFMIPVHDINKLWKDYWRFTPDGLSKMFQESNFHRIKIDGWGNRKYIKHVIDHGWGIKAKDWKEKTNDPIYPYIIWGFGCKQ